MTEKKKLKMCYNPNAGIGGNDVGYQKIDDTTVLERKIFYFAYGGNTTVFLAIYDFNACVATFITARPNYSESGTCSTTLPFNKIGQQAIRDAHQALTELKGSPPALKEILNERSTTIASKFKIPTLPRP